MSEAVWLLLPISYIYHLDVKQKNNGSSIYHGCISMATYNETTTLQHPMCSEDSIIQERYFRQAYTASVVCVPMDGFTCQRK